MTLSIYHNPRCSKSRQTLELLNNRGLQPVIIEYLKTPPTAAELDSILLALRQTLDIMRTGEAEYQAAQAQIKAMDRAAQTDWLANNILVLQRPIVVNGNRARIGRPPEAVLDILDD